MKKGEHSPCTLSTVIPAQVETAFTAMTGIKAGNYS